MITLISMTEDILVSSKDNHMTPKMSSKNFLLLMIHFSNSKECQSGKLRQVVSMCCIKRAIRRSVEVPYMPLRMPRIIDAARLGWRRVFGGPGRQPLLAAVTASGASFCVECPGCPVLAGTTQCC